MKSLGQILDEFYDAFTLLNNNDMAGFKTKTTAVFEMLKSSLKTVNVFPIATIGEKYNSKFHEVVEFWYGIERAAKKCILTGNKVEFGLNPLFVC